MSEKEIKSGEDVIQLSQEQLTREEMAELINKTIKEGSYEAIFILVLNQWRRPGNAYVDYGKFTILYGDAEVYELDRYYDYPTTNETTYSILPKTKVVVILFEDANDYNGKLEKHETLYVFTYHKGWQSIHLY